MSASSGWVAAAVALLLGGGLWLLAMAWRHLLPAQSPSPWVLMGACLAVALPDFMLAAVFALRAEPSPDVWRPAVVAAIAGAAAVAALTAGAHFARVVLPCAVVAALAVRTAETLGRHLAPLLRLPSDYRFGEWVDQDKEARRAVLEVWVPCVLAATVARLGAAALPALAAAAASGVAIAAGARLNWADRLAAAQGYDWPEQDRVRAWTGVGALGALALGLALLVPAVPALLSGRVMGAPFIWIVHWMFSGGGAPAVPPTTHAVPPAVPRPPIQAIPPVVHSGPAAPRSPVVLPAPLREAAGAISGLLRILWEIHQNLLGLVPVAILLTLLVAYLRYAFDPHGGDWRQPLRRLWEALLGLFSFWRWLSRWWGSREQRLARALGAAGERGPEGAAVPRSRPESWLDPRRAVRAAYRRYLVSGAASGLPRAAPETPADYAHRLRAELGPAASEAGRLTSAYEEARFSDHRIGRSAVAVAIAAMRRTLEVLRRAK